MFLLGYPLFSLCNKLSSITGKCKHLLTLSVSELYTNDDYNIFNSLVMSQIMIVLNSFSSNPAKANLKNLSDLAYFASAPMKK